MEGSLQVFAGDVTGEALGRRLEGRKFRLVLANIVADVIIALAGEVGRYLEPEGVFICSGIIDGRERGSGFRTGGGRI